MRRMFDHPWWNINALCPVQYCIEFWELPSIWCPWISPLLFFFLISDFMLRKSPLVCSSYRARASFTGKWTPLYFPSPWFLSSSLPCLFLQLLLKLESMVGEESSSANLGMCSARQHCPLPWQSLGSSIRWQIFLQWWFRASNVRPFAQRRGLTPGDPALLSVTRESHIWGASKESWLAECAGSYY